LLKVTAQLAKICMFYKIQCQENVCIYLKYVRQIVSFKVQRALLGNVRHQQFARYSIIPSLNLDSSTLILQNITVYNAFKDTKFLMAFVLLAASPNVNSAIIYFVWNVLTISSWILITMCVWHAIHLARPVRVSTTTNAFHVQTI